MFGLFSKATDPVCKMKVDKNKTEFSGEYEGKKYYFCSENCQKKFDANPKDFVKKTCCG